jgi:glycosyltransferase involved in cell wall biosynthesis
MITRISSLPKTIGQVLVHLCDSVTKTLPPYFGIPELTDEVAYACTYDPAIKWPRISIITPSFNQAQYLETTIRSVLLQDYPNLQYIVIDGGSKDATVSTLEKYSDHISYWVSEKDRGQSHAINKGLALCDGEIFNWINSDDWLEPGALKTIAEMFLKHDALTVGTRTNLVRNGQLQWVGGASGKVDNWIDNAWSTGLNQQGLYYRISCIRTLNGVDENYHYSMDLDLWVRFQLTFGQDRCFTCDDVTSTFRLHDDCKSGDGWGPGSPSDVETKAMRFRLAAELKDPRYFPALEYLFPDYKKDLAQLPVHSPIPTERIGEWLNKGLFKQMKKAYYAEDFERSATIGACINPEFLETESAKDCAAFLRYSKMYRSPFGRMVKTLLGR